MENDMLRGELERLFELEDLIEMSRDVLGLPPEQVGGTGSKTAFARALIERCVEGDKLDALLDAMQLMRAEVEPRLREEVWRELYSEQELRAGSTFGPFSIVKKLGQGPQGTVYVARREGHDEILKILHRDAVRGPRAWACFETVNRIASRLTSSGMPKQLTLGQAEGQYFVSYEHVEAQTAAQRSARNGAMHINEARALLRGVLEVMAELHARRIVHGNIKAENVLIERAAENGKLHIQLVDLGYDRLRQVRNYSPYRNDVVLVLGDARATTPEQVRGQRADARSDVYAFGALMYEVLTGKAPFAAKSGVELALARLSSEPESPSAVAPRGWISKDVADFVLWLMAREPSARPQDAKAVLEALETLGRSVGADKQASKKMSDEELAPKLEALKTSPDDEDAAAALEQAVELGADPAVVGKAFEDVSEQLALREGDHKEAQKSLLFRAARVYEGYAKDGEKSESVYARIVELDPSDEIAEAALEETRKQLGKDEEVIEMLLARIDRSADPDMRASWMAEIGSIYGDRLKDNGQAVVAYAQAFAVAPKHDEYADAVERCAGSDVAMLGDAIETLAEATRSNSIKTEDKNRLLLRLGSWYGQKLGRSDAALPCFQAVVATEPNNDAALEAMTNLFRSAQQYNELGQVLLRRAEVASSASRARDFRVEAADLLEARLEQPAKAKELYEQVLAADPGHEKAAEALVRIYEKEGNAASMLKLLERRLDSLKGAARVELLVRMAKLSEEKLGDVAEAAKRYEEALVVEPSRDEALRALDRIYTRGGKFKDLLQNLERQVAAATTPRQKIVLLERVASIWEEEFLDHEQAISALNRVLELDASNTNALALLARHYRAMDKWTEVVSVYERELKVTTDKARRVELLLMLARVLSEQLASPDRAMRSYEEVLELESNHAGALAALAALREQTGDVQAALQSIEALAQKATTPKEKVEHYVRAARLLEARDDTQGAVEQYKKALEVSARDTSVMGALHQLYLRRGEVSSALELISQQANQVEAPAAKAKLNAEAAKLAKERLKESGRAETFAKEALRHDPTQIEALTLLGDLAYEAGRSVEALHHYEAVLPRLELLPKDWSVRVLKRLVELLPKAGGAERVVPLGEQLLAASPDDMEAVMLVGRALFEHGEPKRSLEVHQDLLERFGAKLMGSDKAQVLYRHGESARRAGDAVLAAKSLQEAADMDPSAAEPLAALAKVHESKGDWEEVIRVKNRRQDVASAEERVALLEEIGEICASKLSDGARAAKSFEAALELRADDRKLLTRLMQLYSESKQWSKLVDVVLKLADFVDDNKQKAKYIHTASIVLTRQLGELDRALACLNKVMVLDPSLERAVDEALALYEKKEDFEGVERLLKVKLDRATDRDDHATLLKTFDALGHLYQDKLTLPNEAIDAYEAAQVLDPDNAERNQILAELYASDPAQYLDKAVAAQRGLLAQNTNRVESYKLLRRLYTESKRADGAWCLCQALSVLGLAETDEQRFYERMRSETAAPARARMAEEDWTNLLMHEDADPILTSILALIEPAILATRADTLENLGYDPRYAIDLTMHPYPMSQMIYYAAGVLGMTPPPTFQNINDEGGISFLHAQIPSIVLGRAAFEVEVPQQASAFIVARHLTYYRPGLYVRHLVPTGTGLKAWVFAAIRLNSPQFPVSADLEGPVADNHKALSAHLSGPTKEHLASLVSKLLQSGRAMDLKRWVTAVDLTADRMGMVLAHDLETAADMIKGSDDGGSAVSQKERLTQLVLYSISEQYFALRRALGVAIDS